MSTRELLSPAQRPQFTEIPTDLAERDLARYYILSPEDLRFINRHRGSHNRLGFAIQLCYLRHPGRPWRIDEKVSHQLLDYVAKTLRITPQAMTRYAQSREVTRREHLMEIQQSFGYRIFTMGEYRDLSTWLLPLALSTDRGVVLVSALVERMRALKIIIPALSTVERLGWQVRQRAQRQVYGQLTQGLTPTQQTQLDDLLKVPKEKKITQLRWLQQPIGHASAANFLKIMERLELIRNLHLAPDAGQRIHQNRFLQLSQEGERYTPQMLSRFEPQRRWAILVTLLLERSATLVDQALAMHDRIIGKLMSRSERTHKEIFVQSGKSINEKVRLFARVGRTLIDAKASGQDPYQSLEAVMAWEEFVVSVEDAEGLSRPADFDYLDLLDAHYAQLRRYTPQLLSSFEFKAAPSATPLLEAVDILKNLNATGRRKLPEDAPTSFVKPRWERHVIKEGNLDRHYYEICTLTELRGSLRSGDISVVGSRLFKDFQDYLLPEATWEQMRAQGSVRLGITLDFETYWQQRQDHLHEQLTLVSEGMRQHKLLDVRMEKERLHISPLQANEPAGMDELSRRVYALLPRIKITDLLVEVDQRTGMGQYFTHLHTGQAPADKLALLGAILADGINLGLVKMAGACEDFTYDRLVWVSDWCIRDESYTKALAEVINAHHRLPFAAHWGEGTTSSSDGQRFKAGGKRKSIGHVNAKYGQEPSVLFYTHLSDQYGPYHTKVISSLVRDAPYMLDGLLHHESQLKIQEHYTDTAGFTDQIFAMCHLLGYRFAPRMRDLADMRLYTVAKAANYPGIASLIGGSLNLQQLRQHWEGMLHVASSLRSGTVPASLLMSKLASYPRQNGLATALRELGRLERTLFTLEWLQSPELRRRVTAGLNKGEARNALARAVFFNRLGTVEERSYEDQSHRASGLNLVVAAIIFWNTLYLEQAVTQLKVQGVEITDEQLAHLSPLGWEHIQLTGDYRWNYPPQEQLEQLRPLRI